MGVGIAQVAAQAKHRVFLLDSRAGAAAQAKQKLQVTLDSLVFKQKITAQAALDALAAITPIDSVDHLGDHAANVDLAIEAIVEDLKAKRSLFSELETLLRPDCILATNTSSISVTAIANGLKHPSRLVGMHFFNPVPLMKLVEVVSGLQTDPKIAADIANLSTSWGKSPVHAKSTPGFIVNRIARPYYAEALALLLEQAASPAVIDSCLRGAGFRMGPCELMDLIGHDTNFAVTCSVYEANFYDKRFVPSLVQREMVDGGLLGRKSGQGFFSYAANAVKPTIAPFVSTLSAAQLGPFVAHGSGLAADRCAAGLSANGVAFERDTLSDWVGVSMNGHRLQLSDGRTAQSLALQLNSNQVAVFDLPIQAEPNTQLAYAIPRHSEPIWAEQVANGLALMGFNPVPINDVPGLIVTRTIAMLINEAADAVHQGVCTSAGADVAMKLGVNYPAGPFEWLARWDARSVIHVLNALDNYYRGERYRVSPWLAQQ